MMMSEQQFDDLAAKVAEGLYEQAKGEQLLSQAMIKAAAMLMAGGGRSVEDEKEAREMMDAVLAEFGRNTLAMFSELRGKRTAFN